MEHWYYEEECEHCKGHVKWRSAYRVLLKDEPTSVLIGGKYFALIREEWLKRARIEARIEAGLE